MTNSDELDRLRKRIQYLEEVDGVVFGTHCGADHAGARPWRRPRILAVVGFMRSASPRPGCSVTGGLWSTVSACPSWTRRPAQRAGEAPLTLRWARAASSSSSTSTSIC